MVYFSLSNKTQTNNKHLQLYMAEKVIRQEVGKAALILPLGSDARQLNQFGQPLT